MPIDPVGQGTWCAANSHGLTFGLLNFYQGRLPKGRLVSRGKIVKHCASLSSIAAAKDYIESLNLAKYAPFSLLCFESSPSSVSRMEHEREGVIPSVRMLRWNGRALTDSLQYCPLISSSVDFDEVVSVRRGVYEDMLVSSKQGGGLPGVDDFRQLHRSHLPTRSARSICMHREDAQTVSFSQVTVTAEAVTYRYADGPLCTAELDSGCSIARL